MSNYKLSLLGLTLLMLGCSTETLDTPQEVTIQEELQAQLEVTADAQEPAAVLDNTKEGIYHGVIASGITLSRGKVWLNLGNNTEHTATITMVDGMTAAFTGVKVMDNDVATYHFMGENGSFKVIENTVNQPEITEVILNDEDYFMYTIKSTSQTRATAYTGTFSVTGGNASGTWNILSDGVTAPNGTFVGGTAISDLMVTYNGAMESDNTFEIGEYCGSPGDPWTPIVDVLDTPGDGILAFDQSSTLFGGETTWDIGYTSVFTGSPVYVDNEACSLEATSGIFSWVSSPTLTQTGTILVD